MSYEWSRQDLGLIDDLLHEISDVTLPPGITAIHAELDPADSREVVFRFDDIRGEWRVGL